MRRIGSWLKTRNAALLVLAAMVLGVSGCLAVAAGAVGGAAVGYGYYMGEVFDKFPAPYPATVAAARAALRDLSMPPLKEDTQGDVTILESRTKEDDVVRVSLSLYRGGKPTDPTFTQVGVRVGYFGDKKLCNQLFARMDTHLGLAPSDRLVPQAQPALGPIQPVSNVGAPPQSPPPPLATK
jgi:hypothetical protein